MADEGAPQTVKEWLVAHPVVGWRRHIWLIATVVVLIGADVATKQWALHYLGPRPPIKVIGDWVQFELLFNSGAAFSLGEGFTVAFAALGLVALAFVVVVVAPRLRGTMPNVVGGLLIAGIAGNLADRIFRAPASFHGHVIDWIAVRHFAVFNVADMCITAAAVVVILVLLVSSSKQPS